MASDQESQQASAAAAKEERKKRRKRRWGSSAEDGSTTAPAPAILPPPPPPPPPPGASAAPMDARAKALALQASVKAKLAALKASKLPKPKAAPAASSTAAAAAAASPALSMKRAPPPLDQSSSSAKSSKRAKVFELDFSVTAPTFQSEKDEISASLQRKKQQTQAPAKVSNPYLSSAAVAEEEAAAGEDEAVDERLFRASKPRSRHKPMNFVEPGKFVEIAERKRQKALNAAESGFTSGRKAGQYVAQSSMAQVYGGGGGGGGGGVTGVEEDESWSNPLLLPDRAEHRYEHMPLVMEWWDMELLPSKLKKVVAQHEGKALSQQTQAQLNQLGTATTSSGVKEEQTGEENAKEGDDKKPAAKADETTLQELRTKCFDQASLSYCKTAALVQHIVPIKPPHLNDDYEKVKPVLHLTKKEMRRQRKLRRQDKQREQQDRIAAGLEPPPEPRLTLQNFIRVMGDQAYVDPSQIEQKVQEQVQARHRAHVERNQANKLTKEQRAAKKTAKVEADAALETKVALFFVQDMSHPYHRAKVDLNAQQNKITGGVLECENPAMACVICEGGPKAIQRYKRLMLVRMKWTGNDEDDDDDEEEELQDNEEEVKTHKFNKNNRCALVWEGTVVKRAFPNFVFQPCETSAQARKVLKAKGVEHYWDQVVAHYKGAQQGFQLKLVDSEDEKESGDGGAKIDAMDES